MQPTRPFRSSTPQPQISQRRPRDRDQQPRPKLADLPAIQQARTPPVPSFSTRVKPSQRARTASHLGSLGSRETESEYLEVRDISIHHVERVRVMTPWNIRSPSQHQPASEEKRRLHTLAALSSQKSTEGHEAKYHASANEFLVFVDPDPSVSSSEESELRIGVRRDRDAGPKQGSESSTRSASPTSSGSSSSRTSTESFETQPALGGGSEVLGGNSPDSDTLEQRRRTTTFANLPRRNRPTHVTITEPEKPASSTAKDRRAAFNATRKGPPKKVEQSPPLNTTSTFSEPKLPSKLPTRRHPGAIVRKERPQPGHGDVSPEKRT